MSDIVIAGIGQIPAGEHWDLSLRTLGARAVRAALKDARGLQPQALYIGNYLGSMVSHQANLGALLAEESGLANLEAFTLEAAEASGAAAFRQAFLAVSSGLVDTALALGVEKVTDVTEGLETSLSTGLDFDYEGMEGVTPVVQAALLMQRYLYQYGLKHEVFEAFPLLAHAQAVHNPHAVYRKALKPETVQQAPMVSDPLTLFDMAPYVDGAAAAIITRSDRLPENLQKQAIRVLGSSAITDTLGLYDRQDPLAFKAAQFSVQQACRQAGIMPSDADLFELDDFTSIYAALSLEAAGLAQPGEGWRVPAERSLPVLTMGGGKARGFAPAANGMYQIVEACLQLRQEAGACQVPHARLAMTQSLGGPAATAITHILKK